MLYAIQLKKLAHCVYKEITFSDGEIISGYENQEGVIWEK
jgi:hypothetical protein